MHNYSKSLSTLGKLQLAVFLCRMIQEEISEVKMEYFISDLDVSLILNQNNLVRKYANLTESRFLLCGTFGNSQIYFLSQSRAVKDNRKQMVTSTLLIIPSSFV